MSPPCQARTPLARAHRLLTHIHHWVCTYDTYICRYKCELACICANVPSTHRLWLMIFTYSQRESWSLGLLGSHSPLWFLLVLPLFPAMDWLCFENKNIPAPSKGLIPSIHMQILFKPGYQKLCSSNKNPQHQREMSAKSSLPISDHSLSTLNLTIFKDWESVSSAYMGLSESMTTWGQAMSQKSSRLGQTVAKGSLCRA